MIVRDFVSADKEDFHQLCKLFYDTHAALRDYDYSITERTFLRIMDHHENLWGYMFIDKDSDQSIGYALVTSYWSNEEGGDVIILDEIFLNPLERRKGYARLFMDWLEEQFPDAAALTLEVLETNERACEFYKRAGFVPDGYISFTKKGKAKRDESQNTNYYQHLKEAAGQSDKNAE